VERRAAVPELMGSRFGSRIDEVACALDGCCGCACRFPPCSASAEAPAAAHRHSRRWHAGSAVWEPHASAGRGALRPTSAAGGGQWKWASWGRGASSNPSQLPEHEAGRRRLGGRASRGHARTLRRAAGRSLCGAAVIGSDQPRGRGQDNLDHRGVSGSAGQPPRACRSAQSFPFPWLALSNFSGSVI